MYDTTDSNMSANIAEGNLISTQVDLARWLRLLLNGQAGPDRNSIAAMMTTTQLSDGKYGLGLAHVAGLGYGHAGAHVGYLSQATYDPVTDVAVVVYCNIWDVSNMTTAQVALLEQVAKEATHAAGY